MFSNLKAKKMENVLKTTKKDANDAKMTLFEDNLLPMERRGFGVTSTFPEIVSSLSEQLKSLHETINRISNAESGDSMDLLRARFYSSGHQIASHVELLDQAICRLKNLKRSGQTESERIQELENKLTNVFKALK
jgi:hypothetical protein